MECLSFDSIDVAEAESSWLDRDFEEGQVLEVVKAVNGDKAPSPNSYSMAFLQAYWVVLKEDIIRSFMTSKLEVSLKEA